MTRQRESRQRPGGRGWAKRAAAFVAIALSLILLAASVWIRLRFGSVTLEQVILNLPIENGEGVGNASYVPEVAFYCIVLPVSATALGFLASSLWSRSRSPRADQPRHRRMRRLARLVPAIGLTAALAVFLTVAGVPQYAIASLDTRSVAPYYVTPVVAGSGGDSASASSSASAGAQTARSGSATKKNLITIYLESMEDTFEDASLFGSNLLAPLDEATADWSRYDGLTQYVGGGWTMAGMVSTQCGVPLKSRILTSGVDPNAFGESVSAYLPGATCLGDILSAQGYTGVYLGGAAAGFAGKSTFYLGHGYSEDIGLDDWKERGIDPSEISSQWGLSDHELFQQARGFVRDLESSGSPFALTMITLDTHEPGQSYPSCPVTTDASLAHSIQCSMTAVADFIGYLKATGVLDDTVVVIMGDHLKPTSDGNQYRSELSSVPDRHIVFRVWDPDGPVSFTRPEADQLSVMPTVLDLLGFPLVDGRGGLGVSFAGAGSTAGTLLGLPADEYASLLTVPSNDLYKRLWGEPE